MKGSMCVFGGYIGDQREKNDLQLECLEEALDTIQASEIGSGEKGHRGRGTSCYTAEKRAGRGVSSVSGLT